MKRENYIFMKNIKINEGTFSFEEYFNASKITDNVKNKLDESDIIILPQRYKADEFYFAQESIDFVKFCKRNNQEIKTDILANINEIPVMALHSFDIWMPIIWICKNFFLPLTIELVANYIYDKIKGREHENVNLKASFIVKNGKKSIELHYDGDAKTFKDTFKKIDINQL